MSTALAEPETQVENKLQARPSYKISEEKTVYLISRRRELRCRLWYEVTPLRPGVSRYFLVGIEVLE